MKLIYRISVLWLLPSILSSILFAGNKVEADTSHQSFSFSFTKNPTNNSQLKKSHFIKGDLLVHPRRAGGGGYHNSFIFFLPQGTFCQSPLNSSPIINQKSSIKNHFSLSFSQSFYLNTNLPNLENQNGYYFPKGFGFISTILFQYHRKHLTLTAQPQVLSKREYAIKLPHKDKLFSVLNGVPLNDAYRLNINQFRNMGLQLHFKGISAGYGNWDQWWGPGIHNSLVLSNNTEGFYHYYVGTTGYQPLIKSFSYKFKYMVSDHIKNWEGDDYYFSAWFLNIKYNVLEIGMSRNVFSGGYRDLPWTLSDAMTVLVNNKSSKYWDTINEYYLLANFRESGLKIFLDIGFPNRSYAGKDPEVYSDHAMGSNLGLRKQGAFGSEYLLFGFEYTRLVQGIYYNILPTPNWYDNIKYNYSSYKGRRWAAHSGADSDDFLIFIGYKDEQKSFIYGVNYERHGVTYHFPPEVKIESRINASYTKGNTQIQIIYENEYFEHYGFVDVNRNVWDETFEPGSLQRTHTLLISFEHTLSF
ncbi:MAG: hypothetical protein HN982_10580 [Candidatus Marinimicrobia bacterium]|nr:hypothetical protein [Candidatus Neomarinimicrobiota bacterium]